MRRRFRTWCASVPSPDTEEAARRQFEQLRVSASKAGDAVVLDGRLIGRNVNRLTADIAVQIPRQTQVVKVETRGGSLSFNSISGSIVGVTGGGDVKLDDVSGPVKITSGGGDHGSRQRGLGPLPAEWWRQRVGGESQRAAHR